MLYNPYNENYMSRVGTLGSEWRKRRGSGLCFQVHIIKWKMHHTMSTDIHVGHFRWLSMEHGLSVMKKGYLFQHGVPHLHPPPSAIRQAPRGCWAKVRLDAGLDGERERERERERALELELELELGSFCAHLDAEIRS